MRTLGRDHKHRLGALLLWVALPFALGLATDHLRRHYTVARDQVSATCPLPPQGQHVAAVLSLTGDGHWQTACINVRGRSF